MKRIFIMIIASALLSSCATVMGGKVTPGQKKKPVENEAKRQLRTGYLVADIILCLPCLAVDFATGAIYKPVK